MLTDLSFLRGRASIGIVAMSLTANGDLYY